MEEVEEDVEKEGEVEREEEEELEEAEELEVELYGMESEGEGRV